MIPRPLASLPVLAVAAVASLTLAQTPPASSPAAPKPAVAPASIAKVDLPAMTDDKPRDFAGLHNVVAYHQGFYSGSVPEGDEGFETLVAMGVKTIISVDGAEPDLAESKAHGLKYIHLPIGYNGFDDQRKLELVRATRDALNDGPVYMHCHHGKHRSAGAAAAVSASMGWLTPQAAVERMKVSGTAPNYAGLYRCASDSVVLDVKVIDAVPADFPEVSHPATFVKAMVEIDEINDRLKSIEKAGWTVPKDHPDLVPAAEAGRMADHFRLVAMSDKAKAEPEDFAATLTLDSQRVTALEDALAALKGKPDEAGAKALSEQFKAIQTSCKDCHTKHRD